MAAINPWPSWGTLMDQSWGMGAADSAISWALCPQDPAWYIEGSPEDEGRRAAGLLAAQVQVRWHFCFFLKGHCVPKGVSRLSSATFVDVVP
uniref:Zinc finger protein 606 n=1 Tax=Peromyscus maniculatus bairdii TaxID=230844 RepID=A0A8C8W3W8_PERMB